MSASLSEIQPVSAREVARAAWHGGPRANGLPAEVGLVLPGGGARAAYQVGVLRGIADLLPEGIPPPFRAVGERRPGRSTPPWWQATRRIFAPASRSLKT